MNNEKPSWIQFTGSDKASERYKKRIDEAEETPGETQHFIEPGSIDDSKNPTPKNNLGAYAELLDPYRQNSADTLGQRVYHRDTDEGGQFRQANDLGKNLLVGYDIESDPSRHSLLFGAGERFQGYRGVEDRQPGIFLSTHPALSETINRVRRYGSHVEDSDRRFSHYAEALEAITENTNNSHQLGPRSREDVEAVVKNLERELKTAHKQQYAKDHPGIIGEGIVRLAAYKLALEHTR